MVCEQETRRTSTSVLADGFGFLRRHDSIGWLLVACLLKAVHSYKALELLALYAVVAVVWRKVAFYSVLLAAALLSPLAVLRERCVLRPGRGIALPSGPQPLLGQNVLITGSTSGIGLFAAHEFQRRGATVTIHGSREKAKQVVEITRALQQEGPGRFLEFPFDLEDFAEVRNASARLRELMPQIHFLVLNAAVQNSILMQHHRSKSGHDKTMAINQLGHFLLFSLVEDLLAPGARVVVVSSGGAYYGYPWHLLPQEQRLNWDDPAFRARFAWGARQAYQDSKLANVCFGASLQRRLAGRATVVNLDPGFVLTGPHSFTDVPRADSWAFGPARKGGENLFHACFVQPAPTAPDWVIGYFLPREAIAWWVHWLPFERLHRHWIQTYFEFNQQFTNGLHVTIGPICREPLQTKLWEWSLHAVGLAA